MTGPFEPKVRPEISPPKDDPITIEDLRKYDGSDELRPVYVAIKGVVYDVTPNRSAYETGKSYHIFAGRDASRALAKSSLRIEDASDKYDDLSEQERHVLDDWEVYFQKRYSVVGKLVQN